jgi:hypothetical protein
MACPFLKTAKKCFLGALKNPEMKTRMFSAAEWLHNKNRIYKQFLKK